MHQSTLLQNDHKLRYGIPYKVTKTQYDVCMKGDLKGSCSGKLENGEYYLTLINSRFKFMVELTLNCTE